MSKNKAELDPENYSQLAEQTHTNGHQRQ